MFSLQLVQNWTRDLAAAETGEATKFEGDLKKGREPVLNIAKGLSKLALDIIGSGIAFYIEMLPLLPF